MSFFTILADGTYLSPDKTAEQFEAMEFVVYDFLGTYLPNHYAGQIEKSQKVVAGLVSTREDLSKDIKKNSEDIEKMKKEIENLKKENENKAKELSNTKEKLTTAEAALATQQEKVAAIKAAISRGN
jgi:peptidoglycan hydrolase CwlO-like protein